MTGAPVPAGWVRGEFDADSPSGPVPRRCYRHEDAPGLCVNRDRDGDAGRWVVSHERSGRYVRPEFATMRAAGAYALDIAPMGDWRRTGEEILEDEQLRARVVMLREPLMVAAAAEAGAWASHAEL